MHRGMGLYGLTGGFMGLVEERKGWREEFVLGDKPFLLVQYEQNVRGSELLRFSEAVERLCEYAVWLEEKT